MTLTYTEPINPKDIKRPQVRILQYLGTNQTVLDAGCAGGRVSKLLFEKGCIVIGIEKNPRLAELASPFCKKVIVGDLEDKTIAFQIPDSLDVIIFSDILEHLKEPKKVLVGLLNKLRTGGKAFISIPNVVSWRMRWQFLFGHFEYQDYGILDRTHLRFYNYASAKDLCRIPGYSIQEELFCWDIPILNFLFHKMSIYFDRANRPQIKRRLDKLPEIMAKSLPNLLANHFIFILEKEKNIAKNAIRINNN